MRALESSKKEKERALEGKEEEEERMRALESSKKKKKRECAGEKRERMRAVLNEEEDKKEGDRDKVGQRVEEKKKK